MNTRAFFFFLAAAGIVGGTIIAGALIAVPLMFFMYVAIPFFLSGVAAIKYPPHKKRRFLDDGFRSEPIKIKNGRFKGKMLMSTYDERDIEHEVLDESVEAMLERVCKNVDIPPASSLAQSTILRLEPILLDLSDPWCGKCDYKTHRVSDHDAYVKREIEQTARDLQILERKAEAARLKKQYHQYRKTSGGYYRDAYDENY